MDATKKLAEDVKTNNLEKEKEESELNTARTEEKKAKDTMDSTISDCNDLKQEKEDLENLVRIENKNIGYWQVFARNPEPISSDGRLGIVSVDW